MLIDFPELCEAHGVPYMASGHHHCHQGWIQINCPYCGDTGDGWHLGFRIDGGNFHCWRCGRKDAWEVFRDIFHLRPAEIKGLETAFGVGIQPYRPAPGEKVRPTTLQEPPNLGDLSPVHAKFLSRRGLIPGAVAERWNLRGADWRAGDWAYRIVAPIRDKSGRVVAHTGRTVRPDEKQRWKTTANAEMLIDPRRLLYGIEHVKSHVVIVEGASDVWKVGLGAVATLGIDWHIEQANILRKIKNRFVMYDPEPLAQTRAEELANFLSGYAGKTEIINIEGMADDPGDLSARDVRRIRREFCLDKRR